MVRNQALKVSSVQQALKLRRKKSEKRNVRHSLVKSWGAAVSLFLDPFGRTLRVGAEGIPRTLEIRSSQVCYWGFTGLRYRECIYKVVVLTVQHEQ